jgi:nuclear pore complex protein Nup155
MGLFPEIDRAWVSIDNRLYLWNYKNGGDFYEFDELDQVIISVALVAPKPGIFKDYIKYVLVLATSVEVVLVAVTFSDGIDEINLLESNSSFFFKNQQIIPFLQTM